MVVFLNGRFVAEDAAQVSAFDRGFLYGDGLFETLRIVRGRPLAWDAHVERFARGSDFLKLLQNCKQKASTGSAGIQCTWEYF